MTVAIHRRYPNHSLRVTAIPFHSVNPALNRLHWSWQGGYIFMALAGYFRADAEQKGFAYHLARDPFRTRINLSAPLELRHDAWALNPF